MHAFAGLVVTWVYAPGDCRPGSFSLAAAHKVIAYSATTKAVGMQNLLADGQWHTGSDNGTFFAGNFIAIIVGRSGVMSVTLC